MIHTYLPKFKLSQITLTKIAIAMVVLACAHFVGILLGRIAARVVNKKEEEQRVILFSILGKTIYWIVIMITLFILPTLIGFETTAFVALFGSVLFAIGLGLQGTLADLATGVMLIGANTFRIGDYVELNKDNKKIIGKVKSFGILYTTIIDETSSVLVTIPNRILYETPIINHSSAPLHVTYFEFVVSNKNKDLSTVLGRLSQDLLNAPGVLKRDRPYKVACNISRITPFGTVIEVRLPMSIADFQVVGTISIQAQIMTFIHKKLHEYGVELVDLTRPIATDHREELKSLYHMM